MQIPAHQRHYKRNGGVKGPCGKEIPVHQEQKWESEGPLWPQIPAHQRHNKRSVVVKGPCITPEVGE